MLDGEHAKLVDYLEKNHRLGSAPEHQWVQHPESGILGTYFKVLKAAHRDLDLRGPFNPAVSGHCIAFPADDGAWVVVSTTTADHYWCPLNWEPDTADSSLLRLLRSLGPVTAAEALRLAPEAPALRDMTATKLGLRLRGIKRRGPIYGMMLTSKSDQSGTQVWSVVRPMGGGLPSETTAIDVSAEHPDVALLRAWRQLGPGTATDALQRLGPTGLIRESTPQAMGARFRELQDRPIGGMVLRGKWKRWWVEELP